MVIFSSMGFSLFPTQVAHIIHIPFNLGKQNLLFRQSIKLKRVVPCQYESILLLIEYLKAFR